MIRIVADHFFLFSVLSLFCASLVVAQENDGDKCWKIQTSDSEASLRGLSVVNEKIVWASGTGGTVLRTVDAGETWESVSVADAKELDFRDIEAFDEKQAIVISAGTPSRVYRTVDAGQSWEKVFEHENEKAFFDAMDFSGEFGIAFSDPLDGRLELIVTRDRGKSWIRLDKSQRPDVTEGEAGFAASGTCLVIFNDVVRVGLGGKHEGDTARMFSRDFLNNEGWQIVETPLNSSESSGIFSIAFANSDHGVVVGGDYQKPDDATSNVAITDDGGKTWRKIEGTPPSGYRSAVAIFIGEENKSICVCVGTNGTDVSSDFGNDWKNVSKIGFHAIAFSSDGKAGWAVGPEGRIGKMDIEAVTN